MRRKNGRENMAEYFKKLGRVSAPILLHLLLSAIVVYVGTVICMLKGWSGPDATLMTVLGAAVSLPFLWRMWKRDRQLSPSAVPFRKRSVWFYVLAFGCGAAASCLGSALMQLFRVTSVFSNAVQEELFAGNILLQFFGLGFVAPAAEELIFRGLFYQRLRENVPRNWSVLLTSVIFALWHQDPIQMIYAFPMALLLQLFYEKCGSLKAPILFHAGANLISVAVEYFLL